MATHREFIEAMARTGRAEEWAAMIGRSLDETTRKLQENEAALEKLRHEGRLE